MQGGKKEKEEKRIPKQVFGPHDTMDGSSRVRTNSAYCIGFRGRFRLTVKTFHSLSNNINQ